MIEILFIAKLRNKAEIEKQTGRDADGYVHLELLYQKVLEFLVENAEIK